MINELRKALAQKIGEFDKRIRKSFSLMKKDIEELAKTVDLMRDFLKTREKKFESAWIDEDKLRKKFRHNVDEFNQNILQLKIALATVRKMQENLVLVKDLANIEERIRNSFKREVAGYRSDVHNIDEQFKEIKSRVKSLEKGVVKNNGKKKSWWKFWGKE